MADAQRLFQAVGRLHKPAAVELLSLYKPRQQSLFNLDWRSIQSEYVDNLPASLF